MQHSRQQMRFASAPRRLRKNKKRGFQGKGIMRNGLLYGASEFTGPYSSYAAISVNGVPTAVPVTPSTYGPIHDRVSGENSNQTFETSVISLKKLQDTMFRVLNRGKKISHKLDHEDEKSPLSGEAESPFFTRISRNVWRVDGKSGPDPKSEEEDRESELEEDS